MADASFNKTVLQGPILETIASILPDFKEQPLEDPEVRGIITDAIDTALIAQYPPAGLIDKEIRKRIIREVLDFLLDKIIIPILPRR